MTTHTQATGDVPQCPACGQYVYAPMLHAAVCGGGSLTAYTDDRVRAALIRIAADHEVTGGGFRKKLSRTDAINIARQVCLEMGWEWSKRCAARENCPLLRHQMS